MSLEVQWVTYGRPAAEALRAALGAAKDDDPLAPVTVVVPSNHVGVAVRRQLATGVHGPVTTRGAGIAAVSFLTVYRLAELLGAAALAGSGRRPVSTPVIAAALRGSLADDPGVFAPVGDHPSTVMALVAAYQELRDVSPAGADRVARAGARAADVVRLCREARRRLVDDWYDEEDLIESALLVASDGGVRPGLGPVVVHLPERLTRHGGRLLAALGTGGRVSVIAATTGVERADLDVRTSLTRLLDGPGDSPPVVDALAGLGPGTTRIVTTSDADDEVRAAVRTVVAATLRGVALERIAILYPTPDPYARLVHDHLAAAGIPANGLAVVPLPARLAGRALLGLLSLPDRRFRRDDVFAWLAGARLRFEGRGVPVSAWERLSRQAGVVSGRDDWDRLLARLAEELRAAAAEADADPEGPAWRAERARTDAERAEALRRFVLGLIDELAAAAERPAAWSDRASWARRTLDRLLGGDRARQRWPLVEQKAAERLERAIARLAGLDAVESATTLGTFVATLEVELEADLGRVGRMGEGVFIGPVAMAAGLDLDLVVVLGLAEGSLPARVVDDSLLPDDERAVGGELALRADRVERQHHDLLAALHGAGHQVLTMPRGDLRRSSVRVPSRWLPAIATRLAGRSVTAEEILHGHNHSGDWLGHVASFDAGIRAVAFPATAQEHRLRALLAASPAFRMGPGAVPIDDGVLVAGAEVVAARRSDRFTRFDGNLAGLPVPSPVSAPTSATRVEGWARCPFAYFAREVLGVDEVENPEDRLRISPIDSGNLMHQVLEEFVKAVLERPAPMRPAPGQPWTVDDRALMLELADRVCGEYEAKGLTGRPIFWRVDRRRIVADLVAFLDEDDKVRASKDVRLFAAEMGFGLRNGSEPVTAELPDGRTVSFRGLADRVDRSDDGRLLVFDYKTGRADPYRNLGPAAPLAHGTRLQLAVYGLAARQVAGTPQAPVEAEYWFVTRKEKFRRIGYPVTDAVLDEFRVVLGEIVAGIESGVFPNYPTDTATSLFVSCAYCDPDHLGVTDLHRQLAAKRSDPALAGFLALAEDPEAGEEPVQGADAASGADGLVPRGADATAGVPHP